MIRSDASGKVSINDDNIIDHIDTLAVNNKKDISLILSRISELETLIIKTRLDEIIRLPLWIVMLIWLASFVFIGTARLGWW
jgi:hypothetical protein